MQVQGRVVFGRELLMICWPKISRAGAMCVCVGGGLAQWPLDGTGVGQSWHMALGINTSQANSNTGCRG